MAGNSSSLTFKLFGKDVSASKAFAGVSRTATSTHRDIGNFAKGAGFLLAGVAAGAVVAGTAIAVDFAGKSVSAASDMNETLSKTSVLFGDQADALVSWADGAAAAMGQSKQQALDAAGTFGIFGRSAGLSGKALTKFAEQNSQLAGDMASFFNTSPQDAIEAIGAAFRGEMEPIRKYGVLLDDATMRQEAVRLGLVKTTKTALTPQQKVLAAQSLIMKQTTKAQGDFQRTSGGLANQQRILAADFENVKAKVGTALLPILTRLAQFATGTLLPAISNVAGWLAERLGPVIQAVAGWIMNVAWPALQQLAAAFMKNIWPAIKMVVDMVVANLQPAITALVEYWTGSLWPAIQRLIPVLATVAKVIGIVVGVIVVLTSWILGKLIPVVYKIIGVFVTVWSKVVSIVAGAVEWVINHAGEIVDFFKSIPGRIGGFFTSLASIITAPFRIAFNTIASLWNNSVGKLSFTIPDLPGMPHGGETISMPHIPMLANGGIVTRPTLALIGERGPEAIVPLGRRGYGDTHVHFHGGTFIGTNYQRAGRDLRAALGRAAASGY